MTPVDRGQQERLDRAFGDWVRERLTVQKPDKWTQERLRGELAQRGHEVKREWVNQVINGKHASADLRRAIERVLGEFPEPAYGEPISADLADAIREQAVAIEALVVLLAPLVEQATDGIETRLRAVEAELALRAQPADGARQEQRVPDGTAG